ncbi:hypothetical protein L1N85_25760 [Paenibacillus alkaliterrae]|uniref:hypothetical protein n=1 Tax=Paenibacillus alkaliterrae TaxID=320909 RepID=UPI001F1A3C91|nr:hypothetical protein [Paenibacillus alkaliterrae]MCF2941739.1 hypothetical protein [Paenibacillus alkaliterrae]
MKEKWQQWLRVIRERTLSTLPGEEALLEFHRWQGSLAQETQLLLLFNLTAHGEQMPRPGRWLDRLNLHAPPSAYW